MRRVLPLLTALLFLGGSALATIFGTVRGIVHDPQHRPVTNAQVTLQARKSAYTQTVQTDGEGQFHFDAVPLGEYSVKVEQTGFETGEQNITVLSGTAPILHLELRIARRRPSPSKSRRMRRRRKPKP